MLLIVEQSFPDEDLFAFHAQRSRRLLKVALFDVERNDRIRRTLSLFSSSIIRCVVSIVVGNGVREQ